MKSPSSEELVALISSLQCLPKSDKDILIDGAKISYGHAQSLLPSISIFSNLPSHGELDNIPFSLIANEPVYYAGVNLKSNLGVFFDEQKKLIFNSRHYLTHLNAFLKDIEACMYHLDNLKVENVFDIGGGFCAIEKWFVTYGHFKDEAYSLANFIDKLPTGFGIKAFLDYPVDSDLDTAAFKHNKNYMVIDNSIFGLSSFNAYNIKGKVLRLNDLFCVHNGFNSDCFHSFPLKISQRIKSRLLMEEKRISSPKKVLITRSESYRDIGNKAEVERFVIDKGYTLINPEEVSYADLVCILANVESAFFYYGSALTNMVYLPPMSKVFILKSQSYMSENLSLWSKVINSYDLEVSEVCTVSNIIDLVSLDQLLRTST